MELERRLKVIIGAYACSPRRGSEEGVGWGWAKAISEYHDVWVLVGAEFREEIEQELDAHPALKKRMHFSYIRWDRRKLCEKLWPPMLLHDYRVRWQRAAYIEAERLHRTVSFDLAHQLTYVGFRVPGYLWKLGIPFVWGPIGGLEQTNWRLLPALGLRGMLHFTARNLLNDYDRRFRRLPKSAFHKADGGVIAATGGIQREIQRFYGLRSTVLSEIGRPSLSVSSIRRRNHGDALQLVWSGLLQPGKALNLVLEALSRLPRQNWELSVLGDGPCRKTWETLSRRLGLSPRVHWYGKVPRDQALAVMSRGHALIVSSVYDLTSTVVVEALACGMPVVCPDHCGFVDAIDSSCGFRVPAPNSAVLIDGLANAIADLFSEDRRRNLASGALDRSARYSWAVKAKVVNQIYWAKVSDCTK